MCKQYLNDFRVRPVSQCIERRRFYASVLLVRLKWWCHDGVRAALQPGCNWEKEKEVRFLCFRWLIRTCLMMTHGVPSVIVSIRKKKSSQKKVVRPATRCARSAVVAQGRKGI